MILSFFDYLEGELERAVSSGPLAKRPVMQHNLRNMFHRLDLTEQDVRTLRGMIVRLVEGPRRGEAERHACSRRPTTEDYSRRDGGARRLRPGSIFSQERAKVDRCSRKALSKGPMPKTRPTFSSSIPGSAALPSSRR